VDRLQEGIVRTPLRVVCTGIQLAVLSAGPLDFVGLRKCLWVGHDDRSKQKVQRLEVVSNEHDVVHVASDACEVGEWARRVVVDTKVIQRAAAEEHIGVVL